MPDPTSGRWSSLPSPKSLQRSPSGEQVEIVWKDQRATIVEVGGGIRRYEVAGRPVLEPYANDVPCDGAHGAVLIPWPNRLAAGRYRFDGADHQLPISEPATGNAIHGLLRWRPWRVLRRSEARVTMGARLFPMPGYPFLLDVEVDYSLGEAGLRVVTAATNRGTVPCPYGAGHHPYLSPGAGPIDDCTLELACASRIVVDEARQLPIGVADVAGTAYDFRRPRRLGDLSLDCGFTDLQRDVSGLAWARLGATDGRVSELWVDEGYPVLQLYSGDTLAPERRRRGLAVEPMTCPANAFVSGDRLIRLAPGRAVTTRWGARLR